MPKIELPTPEPNESIDSYAVRTYDAPPPSARLEQLGRYLADVDRLQRCATTAHLMLKQETSPDTLGALAAVVAELQDGLTDLQRRRPVIAPNVRHKDDSTDCVNDLGFDASAHIYNLEALLDVMHHRVSRQSDGHLITLYDLCIAELPKLRFALYGEDMGP